MLKVFLLLSFSFSLAPLIGQFSQWNSQKGFVAQGYDVVSYFDNKAQKGKDEFIAEHGIARFRFASMQNMEKFVADPEKYIPQYGGFCAYAMGKSGEKVKINPKSFEIREGKLYLFYKKPFANTLKKWLEEEPDKLKKQADSNWEKIN